MFGFRPGQKRLGKVTERGNVPIRRNAAEQLDPPVRYTERRRAGQRAAIQPRGTGDLKLRHGLAGGIPGTGKLSGQTLGRRALSPGMAARKMPSLRRIILAISNPWLPAVWAS